MSKPGGSHAIRWIALAALVLPGSVGAQLGPEYPDDGSLSASEVAVSDIASGCLTELRPEQGVEIVRATCAVAAVDTLASGPTGTVISVRYLRWISSPDFGWTDSLQVDELLLAEVPPGSRRARPVWNRVAANYFLGGVEAAPHADGLLVQLYNCVRGTGGCVEEVLLRRDPDRWETVALTFLGELGPSIPDGYAIHKGRRIDLTDVTFEQPLATRDDPNCCPSASLRGSLLLVGGSLRLDSAEFVGPPARGAR